MSETSVAEDYLKAIWISTEWSDAPLKVTQLATKLGMAPSSVSEMITKLTERGLVSHPRYGSISLTEEGEKIAIRMVRKHRLIETFLVDKLGYTWDEVHDDAEELEHAATDMFIERLDALLGHPDVDPHGDPIPKADGEMTNVAGRPLAEVDPGSEVTVTRVASDQPELLRYLTEMGITIGTSLTVLELQRAAGTLKVLRDGEKVILGMPAVEAIVVSK